jgi:hypothetical protein
MTKHEKSSYPESHFFWINNLNVILYPTPSIISIKEKEKLVIRVPNKGKAISEIGKIVPLSLGLENS